MISNSLDFTPKELRKLRSLKDPHGIQKFLDAIALSPGRHRLVASVKRNLGEFG